MCTCRQLRGTLRGLPFRSLALVVATDIVLGAVGSELGRDTRRGSKMSASMLSKSISTLGKATSSPAGRLADSFSMSPWPAMGTMLLLDR
eukprot:scaffold1789_cov375-Prasinococcus_capsulatus_cf.AAC.15